MHDAGMVAASAWPERLDLSEHHVMLDVGGGSGAHALGALKAWPNLTAVVLDHESICAVAREFAHESECYDRISMRAADFYNDPFPIADLHFYGAILRNSTSDRGEFLARKSFESLPSGGRIIVHEMLPVDEIAATLRRVGFSTIETIPTIGGWSIVTGRKA